MPEAINVRPARWTDIKILWDDGDYSAIWGKFDGEERLGVRWNGYDDNIGYPSQGGNALWYAEPDLLTTPILRELLIKSVQNGCPEEYINNINTALKAVRAPHL